MLNLSKKGLFMALITKEEIIKLAQLSNIALKEEEYAAVLPQIEEILAYAARVTEFQAPETTIDQQGPANVLRADQPTSPEEALAKADSVLNCAPQVEERYFVVPAIIKQEKNA